mmetsp:Transcript_28047/g.75770  ORF Transcript_28047/g.75770 Transcript_28047/m.75770 type:complete len:326 (-) Transcript_28047:669-1646(-)|eukprot:CAMPEP_0202361762 /NCGR_PEP_ID=MMETSP1126-20121109/14194_1 /ASSEMBLY_ACC=CAM_ASM_000457 /TAXON_ID=3047 /ORGANISM="Dunaliella tertiolecta, Strain CCMP1320" /LENGTH=325 /DNA_ID=CAMNT_0048955777 /DNA_START=98 /DNA_END=1075 /DNA_ORIENTATION=+
MEASPDELKSNLAEYKGQLKQVEELLLMGEGVNEELHDMYTSLTEVIQLTEDLLKEAADTEAQAAVAPAPAPGAGLPGPSAPSIPAAAAPAAAGPSSSTPAAIVTPPQLNLPSILPASVAEQIRKAQIKAALNGQAPAAWAIGAKVQALYATDQQWYNGTVEAVSASGNLLVNYEGYDETTELPLSSVRERPESAEIYMGVAAPKRKRVEEQQVITEIPKWLEIKEGDDEKTVARKKKLIKSCKSKMRFQNMDLAQKAKADNWHNFVSGKGKKKKTGFFTGRKKESQFRVPDSLNAKVGVVGSGKGMTENQKHKPVGALPDVDLQ